VFLRGADGSYVDANPATPGIQRTRLPEAGTAGSLDELALTHVERGFRAVREYHGYYPSVHLNYNISDDFVARYATGYRHEEFGIQIAVGLKGTF
jgi:hypothetical protein